VLLYEEPRNSSKYFGYDSYTKVAVNTSQQEAKPIENPNTRTLQGAKIATTLSPLVELASSTTKKEASLFLAHTILSSTMDDETQDKTQEVLTGHALVVYGGPDPSDSSSHPRRRDMDAAKPEQSYSSMLVWIS
jgi:hypothetical protein